MNPLVRFLCHCSGVLMGALAYAPGSRNRVATMGAILVLVGLIASLTSGYAVTRLFYGEPYAMAAAVVFGTLWGLFVFTLDRLLTMTIVKPSPVWRLALQAAARVPFAIVVAWTLSMPVILRVSSSLLDQDLRVGLRATMLKEQTQNATLERVADRSGTATKTEGQVATQEARLRGVPDSDDWRQAHERALTAASIEKQTRDTNTRRIDAARRTIASIRIQEQTPETLSALQALTGRITRWQGEIARADGDLRQARTAESDARRRWVEREQARLVTLQSSKDEADRELKDAETRATKRDQDSQADLTKLMTSNLVNQYTTYKRILDDPKHSASASLRAWSWSFHLLFFLLEIVPMFVKILAPPDPLDTASSALSEVDKERVLSKTNGQILHLQALMAAAASARQTAVNVWQQQVQGRMQGNPASAQQILKDLEKEIDDMAA